MANLLTGDYDAVVQVSESTLNRLLASMHQNAWQDTSRPSLPHTVGVRLGDDGPIDGVRGSAWAQIGAPYIRLINGATRQFGLEVPVRMRYRPDPGTTYIPTYSVGPLRATYEVVDIDPSCFGWGRVASQYLWIRLVEGSVVFNGDSNFAEGDPAGTAAIDVGDARKQVARQIAQLLTTTFAAKPQRMSSQFQQRLFKSILERDGSISEVPVVGSWVPDVPVGGNAVAVPIGLTDPPAADSIDSIQHAFLAGRDFAVAVSQDVVMAAVNSAVDRLRSYTSATTVTWTIGVEPFAYTDSTVYHGSVENASAVWVPQGTSAQILVDARVQAHTESVLPDFKFRISQPLRLQFDPASESLSLTPETTTVTPIGHPALPGGVWSVIAYDVGTSVQQAASSAIADPAMQSALSSLSRGASEVADQVNKLDAQADAHFDQASFYLSGIVFGGTISVAPRSFLPVTVAHKVDGETFSALDSWFPGGTVTALEWSWSFPSTGATGHQTFSDRWVLRDSEVGPVPGLDGEGKLCLKLWLSTIDYVTGETLEGPAREACGYYTFIIPWRVGPGRFFSRHYGDQSVESGIREISARGTADGGSNALVVFAGRGWSEDDARTLLSGVAGCSRPDAGLLVVAVVGDGELDGSGPDRARSIQALSDRLAVPLVVTEDVDASWSRGLALEAEGDGPSWRLVSPDGGLLWKQDERIEPPELTAVLDGCLYPSPKPTAERVNLAAELQPAMLASLLDTGHSHQHAHADPNCPPWPGLSHADVRSMISAVSFVRKGAASSTAEVDRLRTHNEERGAQDPGVLLVVDGADDDDVRELSNSLGPAFMVVADPDGSVAAGAGVRAWPTTIAIDNTEGGPG